MGKKKDKVSVEDITLAIVEAHGLLSIAANRLGVTVRTLYNYVEKYPEVKETLGRARESMLDFAEGKLFRQIQNDNLTAIIFFLKTQGKKRGYIERNELSGPDGPINVKYTIGEVQEPPKAPSS